MSAIHPYINAWLNPGRIVAPFVYGSESATNGLSDEVRTARKHHGSLKELVSGTPMAVRTATELRRYEDYIFPLEGISFGEISAYLGLRLFVQERQLTAQLSVALWEEDTERQFSYFLEQSRTVLIKTNPAKGQLSDLLKAVVERDGITPTELMRRMKTAGVDMCERTFWRWYWGEGLMPHTFHKAKLAEFLSKSGTTRSEIALVFGEDLANRVFRP